MGRRPWQNFLDEAVIGDKNAPIQRIDQNVSIDATERCDDPAGSRGDHARRVAKLLHRGAFGAGFSKPQMRCGRHGRRVAASTSIFGSASTFQHPSKRAIFMRLNFGL